ncbi:hypothetical protein NDU88_001102 [Pleurodeles waltl]|uniref:Uncharacterized protein n=1 Tax=Pleurodeles waltl TaxID=8319 RepID=A0AAV7V6V9_PLEWA|nr:hypothetical protein NDU88_001102 [Pleurodeles waltl]
MSSLLLGWTGPCFLGSPAFPLDPSDSKSTPEDQSERNQAFTNQAFTNQAFTNQAFTNQAFTNQAFTNQSFTNQASPGWFSDMLLTPGRALDPRGVERSDQRSMLEIVS